MWYLCICQQPGNSGRGWGGGGGVAQVGDKAQSWGVQNLFNIKTISNF